MEETIEKLEKIKTELVELFEESNIEHKAYLIGDCIVVIEDRLSECKNIVKNGIIFRDVHGNPTKPHPYPSADLAPCDYFYRDAEK